MSFLFFLLKRFVAVDGFEMMISFRFLIGCCDEVARLRKVLTSDSEKNHVTECSESPQRMKLLTITEI